MPRVLRILRGNPSKKRMPAEPQGIGDLWSPPDYFDEELRDEWNRVVESAPSGILTGTDRDIVSAYVVAVVEFARAVTQVRKGGQVVKAKNGAAIVNPFLGIMNKQAALIARFGSQLGFSPASRAQLGSSLGSSSGRSSDGGAMTLAQYLAEKPK